MSLDYFKTLTEYNLWANARISDLILSAGENAADLNQQSSFPTIRKTIYHIWDAETIWLNRLHGNALSGWPSKDFGGTLSEALRQWHDASLGFITYLDQLNAEFLLDKNIEYKNLKGEVFNNKVWEVISHCMNHSTFHRGQLVTMLRGAGAENLRSTDMITFYRE